MMPLDHLQYRLERLRRRRQWIRRGTAAGAVAIALLAALGVLFALDFSFRRSEDLWQRLFLLGCAVAAVAWATRRYALPWLGRREDPLEMALLVQRHAGIDSDLVAALQFQGPEAATWGSAQLERAVIGDVAKREEQLDVMAVAPRGPLAKRLALAAALLAAWIAVGTAFPGHLRAFANRLLLGADHYPTRTSIVALKVNGREVDLGTPRTATVRVPYGRAVVFEVTSAGARPDGGEVELTATDGGQTASVTLEPSAEAADDSGHSLFTGQYPRLVQSARYQVTLGDAFTDPLELKLIPAPVVEVQPEVTPPGYARRNGHSVRKLARGARQFAVAEGSEVVLKITSDRPLKDATLTVGDARIALVRSDAESSEEEETWAPATAGTPLAAVDQPLRYAIQVTDADEQRLPRPVEGFIRIEPDQPPTVSAWTRTRLVLPDARPTLEYRVADDHGVSRVWLTCEVVRGEKVVEAEGGPAAEEVFRLAPGTDPEETRRGVHTLSLAPLKLVPGDRVRATVRAGDYRGQREGKAAAAEAVEFRVVDLQDLIAEISKSDQEAARKVENIDGLFRRIEEQSP